MECISFKEFKEWMDGLMTNDGVPLMTDAEARQDYEQWKEAEEFYND
jgi:hypothetical protein